MKSLEVPVTIEADCEALGLEAELVPILQKAVGVAASDQGFTSGSIGLLIADDETIHEINRTHLQHDYPTDVISFSYERSGSRVEGELVASVDTASREAAQLQWSALNELILYVVHGTLHICGLEDETASQRSLMRQAEQRVLAELGIENSARYSPDGDDDTSSSEPTHPSLPLQRTNHNA
jgi:probable rRNA maturation factor